MTEALHCPRCGGELAKAFYAKRICFRCPAGHGECMTVSGVRSLCGNAKFVGELWQNAYYNAPAGSVACPVCRKPMKRVIIPVGGREMELDVCCSCQEIWFDQEELEALPVHTPPPPPGDGLSQAAREALAIHAAKRAAWEAENRPYVPENIWEFLSGLLGFPVKHEKVADGRPYVTYGAILLCAAVFLLSLAAPDAAIGTWGFVPAEPWRHGGLTILTSMFLHAGWVHLGGNMYFLLTFGADIECALGRWKYLTLTVASGLSAVFLHWLTHRYSTIPCVGASGFISGVIAAFAILYPQVKLSFMIQGLLLRYHDGWIDIPAWGAFLLWIGFQFLLAALEERGGHGAGVAYSAHLGGAAAGVVFGIMMRYFRRCEADDFARRCQAARERRQGESE